MDSTPASPSADAALRLAALRARLADLGLAGFVVPHADAHQNEFLPANAERLAWLTGFTGSAGTAVVLADVAAIFVDGRYTLQVRNQVDPALWEARHVTEAPMDAWLREHLTAGAVLGVDPWLHTRDQLDRLHKTVEDAGARLELLDENPVDAVWVDRPPPPAAPVVAHEARYAGRDSAGKRAELGEVLSKADADCVVLTQPESIAWLLNVRGGDVDHTPLPLSFAVAHADGAVDWYVAPAKVAAGLDAHLGGGVTRHDPQDFAAALDALGTRGARVRVCPATAAAWVFARLEAAGAAIRRGPDPVTQAKAIKNEVELAGTRDAHRRDGAALTRFLRWLDETAPAGGVSEIAAADRLEAFRRTDPLFRDLSFDTISGAGPNGAIVHYRVTPGSDRALAPGELYLVDSGAQYLDGTTDVTRTVAVGEPTAAMRDHFTRVLKGHIAIATAVFPAGTTGGQIDALARLALWQAGLDYDHGTGHGVGSYLGVHEGPQRISKAGGGVALKPGMIVSNEPGYYREGAYGIRIENLVAVRAADEIEGAEREMLAFETLTLAPIDRRLIDTGLLTDVEAGWLDAYHARVREAIAPLLDDAADRAWLEDATAPLAR